jgi:DNA processing protein
MADTHIGPLGREADPTTLVLRSRGRWPLPPAPRVAIAGNRRPTPYGEAVAERLAEDLAHAGVTVIAGLAPGIETAAHLGALQGGGYTAAVLGSGVDVVFPAASAQLANRILAAGGALLSPFPDGTQPRANSPRRIWTIAALADLVVIVEAAWSSTALVTVEAADALGKAVMAVPGSVFSPYSQGCHQLLRDGALLVRNAADVLNELADRRARP